MMDLAYAQQENSKLVLTIVNLVLLNVHLVKSHPPIVLIVLETEKAQVFVHAQLTPMIPMKLFAHHVLSNVLNVSTIKTTVLFVLMDMLEYQTVHLSQFHNLQK
jgi:uncharacterized membrane protein (GlpM family)